MGARRGHQAQHGRAALQESFGSSRRRRPGRYRSRGRPRHSPAARRMTYDYSGSFRPILPPRTHPCEKSSSSPRRSSAASSFPAGICPRARTSTTCATSSRRSRPGYWRHLRAEEIEALVKNAVTCDDWDSIFVADPFDPHLIKNCEFSGLVRIGRLEAWSWSTTTCRRPPGITDSTIISCDIGDNCAIHNVRYLAHYIIGDQRDPAEHRRDAHHQPRQVRQRHRQGRRAGGGPRLAGPDERGRRPGGDALRRHDRRRRLPLGQVPRRRAAAGQARRDHPAPVRLPPRLLRHGRRPRA